MRLRFFTRSKSLYEHQKATPGVHPVMPPSQPAPLQAPTPTALPHAGLVVDPFASYASAQEDYRAFQVSSGFDLMHSGVAPQTAADVQNFNAAQDAIRADPTAMPHDPMHAAPLDQPWHAPFAGDPLAPMQQDPLQPPMPFDPMGMLKPPGG